jgi:hypothetical protein
MEDKIANSVNKTQKKDINEGYVGQTLEEFFEDCTDAEAIDKIIVYNTDIDDVDDSIVVDHKSYEEIPENILNASFSDFDVGGGKIVINSSEDANSGYYDTVGDFIDDYNGDDVEIFDADTEKTLYSGDKSDVPEEILDKGFSTFDTPEYISVNVTDVEDDDKDDEDKDDVDESKSNSSKIVLSTEEKNILDDLTEKNKMDDWFVIDDKCNCIRSLDDGNKIQDTAKAIIDVDDGTDNVAQFLNKHDLKVFKDLVARCRADVASRNKKPIKEDVDKAGDNKFTEEEATKYASELDDALSAEDHFYEIYPDKSLILAEVEGDWKHDLLFFEYFVHDFFKKKNIAINLTSTDVSRPEDQGSDWGTYDYTISKKGPFITKEDESVKNKDVKYRVEAYNKDRDYYKTYLITTDKDSAIQKAKELDKLCHDDKLIDDSEPKKDKLGLDNDRIFDWVQVVFDDNENEVVYPSKDIKEDISKKKYVIYKDGNGWKGTPEDNYNARIQDAFKILDLKAFKSGQEAADYLEKNDALSDKGKWEYIIKECNNTMKESKDNKDDYLDGDAIEKELQAVVPGAIYGGDAYNDKDEDVIGFMPPDEPKDKSLEDAKKIVDFLKKKYGSAVENEPDFDDDNNGYIVWVKAKKEKNEGIENNKKTLHARLKEAIMHDGKLDMVYAKNMVDVLKAKNWNDKHIFSILTSCGLTKEQADSLIGEKPVKECNIATAKTHDTTAVKEDDEGERQFNDDDECVYLFPGYEMTAEDKRALKNYGLKFIKNQYSDGYENWVVEGTYSDLKDYCSDYIGEYTMHPDYLYHKDDFDFDDVNDEEK